MKRDFHTLKELQDKCTHNHLVAALEQLDPNIDIIYANLTEKIPLLFIDSMTFVFILYDWTMNDILAEPVENSEEKTLIGVFREKLACLAKRGFNSKLNMSTMW